MLFMKIIYNEKNLGVFILYGGVFLLFYSIVWYIYCCYEKFCVFENWNDLI